MSDRSRRGFLTAASRLAGAALLGPAFPMYAGQKGAAAGAADAYATPKPMNAGPYQPTWESLRDNWTCPKWFNEAKFGIFIHWRLYSIPARINEWYERHMYTTDVQWHTEHYGPPDQLDTRTSFRCLPPGSSIKSCGLPSYLL